MANYNDLPDCATYQGGQDPGRACVPEKGTATNSVFRATNYPSGQVNPQNAQQVVVTFGSYISKDSNPSNGCVPAGFATSGNNAYTGVKTAGACNNKILESVSTNGGTSFNGTVTDPTTLTVVSSASGQAKTDQWFQWSAFRIQENSQSLTTTASMAPMRQQEIWTSAFQGQSMIPRFSEW